MTDDLTDRVVKELAGTRDPRLRMLLEATVRHLHSFVREVSLSPSEWSAAIDFLTAVGKACEPGRQELVMLSDVLGVSTLVNRTQPTLADATPSTVEGPFHQTSSPPRTLGESIASADDAEPCVVSGTVRSIAGGVIPHARVDVWQCDHNGLYDVQHPETAPAGTGRGLFTADGSGRFWFRTVVPSHYAIPTDGPVGELLRSTARHPYRPAHIHVAVSAPGYRALTTHLFFAGSPYLDSDAVFAVDDRLIVDFTPINDPHHAAPNSLRHTEFDVSLAPTSTSPLLNVENRRSTEVRARLSREDNRAIAREI